MLANGRECRRENAIAIGQAINDEIAKVGAGGLRSSVGIAPNHFRAKTRSNMHRPYGRVVIEQTDLPLALFQLELQDQCGISHAMERHVHAHGMRNVERWCITSAARLREVWVGIEGECFHARLRDVEIEMPGAKSNDDDDGSKRESVGHSHVLVPEFRNSMCVDAALKKQLLKAAMQLRSYGKVDGMMRVKAKYHGADAWETSCRLDAADDSRLLLHALVELLKTRRDRKKPLAVGVVQRQLVERTGSSGDLFSHVEENHALTEVMDRINRCYDNKRIFFGGAQEAMAAAPIRITLNRIPQAYLEDETSNEHLLMHHKQARVLGEVEHRKHDSRR